MLHYVYYTSNVEGFDMVYDTTIIGGGPAGVAAGVYAARKKLKTLFVTKEWGGQSVVSPGIQNWIGTVEIPGEKLAQELKAHLEAYAEGVVDIKEGVNATKIDKTDVGFKITLENGEEYESKTLIWTAGAIRRKLNIPGAEEFDQKGLTYCATCDGPVFAGQDVAVVGGGNAGFETAAQLLEYTKSVTLLDYGDSFAADPITVEKVTAHPNMKTLQGVETTEVTGDKMVSELKYKVRDSGEENTLPVTGIFVEIGLVPNTEILTSLVELDKTKHVVVDPLTQRTSLEGIWDAGDCTTGLYHQNNIAVGDAVKALEDVYVYLKAS
jgi:alkyl hydroperoxide reductase subunit F